MITTVCLNSSSKKFRDQCPASEISDLRESGDNVVWADVSDPSSEDFAELAEEFGFHPLSIEDCRSEHQRPKIEEYQGYYFIVLYEAQLAGPHDRLELRELNIFLGANFLVTVHSKPIRAVETAGRLWHEWTDRAEHGAGLLSYLLIDAIVDDYLPLLDVLSDRMDDLEDQIFGEFKPEALEEIFRVKKQLLYLRRSITPLRDVFNTLLRREQPIFARETHVYFQDVFDHLIRVADTIDNLRDMLGSTMDAFLSVQGNRMNMIMKRLTSIATILMSVTLVAGIYGMNFTFMPELHWRYGYVFALLSMVGIGAGLYVYLKKVDWL
ncbi:MAG: magnesium/cobalt transporter CorA [Acidobacteria bacterium]|nr:magnesium/cobalt transporter CorA [Acidobacteriota bacterium]MCA1642197.1 magnesium/cobalt transporter CorA [Acidobacteriota bacterium]